jgi:hypothetical protein
MKKLTAKIGEYVNAQNETKGRYANIGVMMTSNDGGEYMLLDPTVSMGGIFALQQAYNASQGKAPSDRIMVSVWEENSQPQQGYQQNNQQAPQQNNQQPQQGYQAPQSNKYQSGQGYNGK